ncbi:MAG: tRNA (adenosine(37)-N6)-threonylcarbamoyltransferase complex transferase subunit TsaD [Longimonas sp.]|uniref:tRNA (adenosine(37)-N6)-threonylcarbamoyltransferase complex transferase subunit TsaD n=1 Tax=Longimonas sp. TaxID=2039626 RepID=UPI003348B12A
MTAPPLLLGIETSCDDTAAAVLQGHDLHSNVVSSQHDVHAQYGGIVPELASRNHERYIGPVVRQALEDAGASPVDIDGVAVTRGPGLPGALLVGLSFAKAFASACSCPVVGVNHLKGHLYSTHVTAPGPEVPFVSLIVSGGHTQLVHVKPNHTYTVLGQTRDDAAGEAFDKVAQLLNLGYPGGPEVDRLAQQGDPAFHAFPRSKFDDLSFSFSGLKTSVLYFLRDIPEDEREVFIKQYRADICASFQQAVIDVLVDAVRRAVAQTGVRHATVVGGVSANSGLRAALSRFQEDANVRIHLPERRFCMDNAAMIAAAARASWGSTLPEPNLDIDPRLSLS